MTEPTATNPTDDRQPAHARHPHTPTIERHCDVAIIGGSAAGLAAALQLGRQRRSVIVVDAGDPRNAPASHMHSYLGHEGAPPADFTAIGRAEVRGYGTEVLDGRVTDVERDPIGRFRVTLAGGHVVVARRVLAATGLVDELPDIDGLSDHWGTDVLHCPFCHGYEVRDRRLVQIVTTPIGLHPAKLFSQLSRELALVLHDGVDAAHAGLDELRDAGVTVIDATVERLTSDDAGRLAAVELADGRRLDADAVVVTTRFRMRLEPFARLDLALVAHPTGLGDTLSVDDAGQTSVPGLYAAGNVVDPVHQVLQAAADGSRVAGAIALDLATEDLASDRRPAPNQDDWEHRYAGDTVWSGNPNGSLVVEVESMPAVPSGTTRTCLDIGAGEGGDAIWLAERGWQVTATDVSHNAVGRIQRAARDRSLDVRSVQTDANGLDPFGGTTFDLVTACYASIPSTADGRGVSNMLGAVAPGGTLLVIGHAPNALVEHDDTDASSAFDAAAFVSVDDIVAVLQGSERWKIDTLETRPRPAGAISHHHVDDIVLRAHRLSPEQAGER